MTFSFCEEVFDVFTIKSLCTLYNMSDEFYSTCDQGTTFFTLVGLLPDGGISEAGQTNA